MRRPKVTTSVLRSIQLNQEERTRLAMLMVGQRDWIIRHGLPLRVVVERSLGGQWLELLRLEQVEPHPVYEVWVRLGRCSPATREGIGAAVRQAFRFAGRLVKREHVYAQVRGDRAKVTVLADSVQ